MEIEYNKFFEANPDTALERYVKNRPLNSVEEYCFVLLKELQNASYTGLDKRWDCLTAEMQNRFLENWIDKLNNVY